MAVAGILLTPFSLHAQSKVAQSETVEVSADRDDLDESVTLRGNYHNSFTQFTETGKGHVAFLGGSITEMEGYRPRVAKWLQARFPATDFTFTNAGISSTCSNAGAFRLHRDVLSKGSVDLLFVEFAVNDDQDAGHAADGCIQGMEGIIRQTRRHNPKADIIMTHFVNPGMLETLKSGRTILSAGSHERVAEHYDISSVYLSKAVAARIDSQTMTWKQFGGTHPGPAGNQLAADLATSILNSAWKQQTKGTASPHATPEKPLLASSFDQGQLLPPKDVQMTGNWAFSEPAWNDISGSKRSRFLGRPMLHGSAPGAEAEFTFSGTAVGAFLVAGPDAGQLDVQIDSGDWHTVETWHRFSKGLHYPRTVMFAAGLKDTEHHVKLRIAESHHPSSKGTAIRIIAIAVNGSAVEKKTASR